MSVLSVSSPTIPQPTANPATSLPAYFKERRAEVEQLNQALKSGDLSAAQQAYNNIVALGNQVIHRDNPYFRSDRALDFSAIGGALQNGDLTGARQAFAALHSTYLLPPAGNSAGLSPATVGSLSPAGQQITVPSSNPNDAEAASGGQLNISA
jgi:hypothetical protein